jgi:prolyl-tRNA editing enzyme YbaK/EbsC (Cys-tRNA(Pro) deacylase)
MILSDNARRVQDFLADRGFSCEVVELPGSTRTAQDAALSIGCAVAQIAKSLVFRDEASGRPILVVASGANRVDLVKIEKATGLKLGRADARFVKEMVGYAIGGIPPAGHTTTLTTFLDPHLQKYEVIWAAAGTPFAVFALKSADLQSMTGGRWLDLAADGDGATA